MAEKTQCRWPDRIRRLSRGSRAVVHHLKQVVNDYQCIPTPGIRRLEISRVFAILGQDSLRAEHRQGLRAQEAQEIIQAITSGRIPRRDARRNWRDARRYRSGTITATNYIGQVVTINGTSSRDSASDSALPASGGTIDARLMPAGRL